MGNQQYRYGPYTDYIEVRTPFGEWGIPAGQILSFDDEGAPVFADATEGERATASPDPYMAFDAHGNPLPQAVEQIEAADEDDADDPGF